MSVINLSFNVLIKLYVYMRIYSVFCLYYEKDNIVIKPVYIADDDKRATIFFLFHAGERIFR